MIDMKNKVERPDSALVAPEMTEEYPYGLRISLRTEELTKLGITTLPAVGVEMKLVASVRVVSTGQNEYQDGDVNRHVELQIEQMELGTGKTAEQALYPSMLA
jgi:hypothetical protein